jgi:EpsI family protein
MLLVSGTISIRLFLRERTAHDALNINKFPKTIEGWSGKDLAMTEREYDMLETRNLISREYVDKSGKKLYLFIIYSETNRSVFHPPEACLLGSGVTVAGKEIETGKSGKFSFSTNRLSIEKGAQKEMMLYSYKAGDIYTSNFYLQQSYLALQQIFGKRSPGATIRVSMLIDRDEKTTTQTLKKFLATSIKIFDSLQ